MINTLFIKGLSQQAARIISGEKSSLHLEAEKNLQLLLQNAFSKLNLVSRDEFDTQATVLKRTRAKVDQMEAQLATLQEQVDKLNQA